MILAVINGGLGLKLADNTRSGKIVYAVVAAVVALLYAVFVVARRKGGSGEVRGNGERRKGREDEMEMHIVGDGNESS